MGGGVSGGVRTERGVEIVRIGGSELEGATDTRKASAAGTLHAVHPAMPRQPAGESVCPGCWVPGAQGAAGEEDSVP